MYIPEARRTRTPLCPPPSRRPTSSPGRTVHILVYYIWYYICVYMYIHYYMYDHTIYTIMLTRITIYYMILFILLIVLHSCHILPFQSILWNRYLPSEPVKTPKNRPPSISEGGRLWQVWGPTNKSNIYIYIYTHKITNKRTMNTNNEQ